MMVQKFIVLLDERHGKQVWLAYNTLGRIGNAVFSEAFRYETYEQAKQALASVRRQRNWPNAKVMGTTE
jgi:hypothetical protein